MSFRELQTRRKSENSEKIKSVVRDEQLADKLSINSPGFINNDMSYKQLQNLKNNLKEKDINMELAQSWTNPYKINNFGAYNNFSNFQKNQTLQYSKLNQYKEDYGKSPYNQLPEKYEPAFQFTNSNSNDNLNIDYTLPYNANKKLLAGSNSYDDPILSGNELSNRNYGESYGQRTSLAEEISIQGIMSIIFIFSLILSSFNLGVYRKFVYVYENEQNEDLFLSNSFLYKELLVFTWRNQMIFLFMFLYLALVKITESFCSERYGDEYVEESHFFQLHSFYNIFSFLSLNNFIYSAFNTAISFMILLSTAFMPASLTVLLSNSDRFFNFVLMGNNDEEINLETTEQQVLSQEEDAELNFKQYKNISPQNVRESKESNTGIYRKRKVNSGKNVFNPNGAHTKSKSGIPLTKSNPGKKLVNENIYKDEDAALNNQVFLTYTNAPIVNPLNINNNTNNNNEVNRVTTGNFYYCTQNQIASNEVKTSERRPTTSIVTTIIKFFCFLIFIMGWALLFSYKRDYTYYLGLIMPLFAIFININYQRSYMELFISEQKPFQIVFNMVVISNIILFVVVLAIQLFYTKKVDVVTIVGWVYLKKKEVIEGVFVAIVSGFSLVFTIFSSSYLSKNSIKLKKILEIPLTEIICVSILKLYDYVNQSTYYFGMLNIMIVITIIEFIEVFNWLKIKRKDN
jgi:hypothetical protein